MTLQFIELSPQEYAAFESKHLLGTYTQSILQYELLLKNGPHPYLLGVKENGQVIAGSLVVTESTRFGQVFLFDRGPLLDFNDLNLLSFFVKEAKKYAKKHGILYIEWAPNVTYVKTDNTGQFMQETNDEFLKKLSREGFEHQPFEFGMSTNSSPAWEYVKPISGLTDEKSILKSYTKNVQYYLKKNKQFGIQLRQLDKNDLPDFKKLTATTAKRLNYHDKDLSFYEMLYDIYGNDATFMFAELNFEKYISEETEKIQELNQKLDKIQQKIDKYPLQDKFKRQFAEFNDQKQQHIKRIAKATEQMNKAGRPTVVIAGALFIQQPQEMTYLYSGTYEEYMDYYGPYQIQHEMIKKAVAGNIDHYNFYGISGHFDGTDGVFRFKTAFSGYARQLVGRFILPVHPLKYRLYRLLKHITGRA